MISLWEVLYLNFLINLRHPILLFKIGYYIKKLLCRKRSLGTRSPIYSKSFYSFGSKTMTSVKIKPNRKSCKSTIRESSRFGSPPSIAMSPSNLSYYKLSRLKKGWRGSIRICRHLWSTYPLPWP